MTARSQLVCSVLDMQHDRSVVLDVYVILIILHLSELRTISKAHATNRNYYLPWEIRRYSFGYVLISLPQKSQYLKYTVCTHTILTIHLGTLEL